MEGQLYEKIWVKRRFQRVMDSFILVLLLLLLGHRVMSLVNCFSYLWFVAFLCESWFAFTWFVILSTKWSPALLKTHLHSLLHRIEELPAVDLFVTTADPVLEPPIITVNTVLSLLALDYPSHKLACYVSDDGCSPLTFHALLEASHFAKLWVPFCKKHNVQLRAPFRYFSHEPSSPNTPHSPQFTQEWLRIKEEYEKLSRKIEDASRKSKTWELEGEFAVFSNTQRRNHPPIIKVICENKEGQSDVPHLLYISREKRPEHPHHYKAGAMNVLTRVSGLMTNAPFMLNVDCDMMVNNPKIVQHAMCIFLDPRGHKEVGFVQCFQQFYDGIKDDPFGNQWVAAFAYIVAGIAGLQGPYYGGTNCFHRRNVIYGLSPDDDDANIGNQEKSSEKELGRKFGSSKEFVKLAAQALEGNPYSGSNNIIGPSEFLEAANEVARCGYEYGTAWGKQVGWLYGSLSEDVLTGLSIHRKGWRSECCTPEPIAFTGCAPGGCISTMTQQKRWASGLLVVLLGPQSPVLGFLFGKIQFRECLSYLWLTCWGLRSVPETLYAVLPPYSIITNTTFLPKGRCLWIPLSLFAIYNAYNLAEYIAIGLSIRTWWNNQRMSLIRSMNPWLLGFLSGILKLLGISDTVFEITQKEPPPTSSTSSNSDSGIFTFDDSPVFLPGTTVLLLQLAALAVGVLRWRPERDGGSGSGVGEVVCSAYVVACYWPFLKGLFGKGEHGIPLATALKAATMAVLFVQFCRTTVIG